MNFDNTKFNQVDFNNFVINSELFFENMSYLDIDYIQKNRESFLEFIRPKLKLKKSESCKVEIKHGNEGRASIQMENDEIISVLKGENHELLIMYNDSTNNQSVLVLSPDIPIKFDYTKIRNKARFIDMDLSNVSLKGVNLSNVEFHRPKWRKLKLVRGTRNIVVDEESSEPDYESIAHIYNQLRKNYESELKFNLASDFFIGEMESIRKGLLKRGAWGRATSFGYSIYYGLAKYGESIFLPLLVWTPFFILLFMGLRFLDFNSITNSSIQKCDDVPGVNVTAHCTAFANSLSAYFQFPRADNLVDIIERIVSLPILATVFIALKRRFERTR